jgi:hypothetical protein
MSTEGRSNKTPLPQAPLPTETREVIQSNTLSQQVEQPVESSPEDVDIDDTSSIIQTKQKEDNIGLVDTPEQRVGDNNKSDNLPNDKNTPLAGSKPFQSAVALPELPENEEVVIDQHVGFTYPRGNYFIDEPDTLPEVEVFNMSAEQDVRYEDRARDFQDFFN